MGCDRFGRDLARYRELSQPERQRVDTHGAACPACAMRLAAFTAQDEALAGLPDLRPSLAWTARTHGAARSARPTGHWMTMAQRVAVVVVALAMLLATGVKASANALPGDALYPLKRAQEELRLRLTAPGPGQAQYQEVLQAQRRNEAKRLIQQGRTAQIRFEGEVEVVGEGVWTVGGLPVRFRGADSPRLAAGDWVEVRGRTVGGIVEAHRVTVVARAPERPAPAPTMPLPKGPQRQGQMATPTASPASATAGTLTPETATPRQGQRPMPAATGSPHGTATRVATTPGAEATVAPGPTAGGHQGMPAATPPSPNGAAPTNAPGDPASGPGRGPGAPQPAPQAGESGGGNRGATESPAGETGSQQGR